MTYHFPDAYAGQNTKIRDTLNNLILKSPQSWQTSVGLPFFQIEGTVVEWDEVRFDVRLMQRVPYEGVSRMQTSLRRKHRDRVVRRGLALIIESDFYATDAGRQHFANQLTSIRYCVQETCNFDTLYAYLTCGNYDFNYGKDGSRSPPVPLCLDTLTLALAVPRPQQELAAEAQHPDGDEPRDHDVRHRAEGAARLRQGGRGM